MTLIVTQCTCQGTLSVNVLESVPPAEDGVLTVYTGQQISLTCSHNNTLTATTRWIASPPVDCETEFSHIGSNPPLPPPCGPFMFQGITPLFNPLPPLLNSTAVAIAQDNMNGTNIECIGGNVVSSFSVGSISLSVISPTVVGKLVVQNIQTKLYKIIMAYNYYYYVDHIFVMTAAPIPIIKAQLFCANSSDFTITVALSWTVR